MNKELHDQEAVAEQEERPEGESSRRNFLKQGSIGVAGLAGAAAVGFQPAVATAQSNRSGKKHT